MTKADWQKITVLFITSIIVFALYGFIFMLAWNYSIALLGIVPPMEYAHALWFIVGTNVIKNAAKSTKND
jgi:hypothetical protein